MNELQDELDCIEANINLEETIFNFAAMILEPKRTNIEIQGEDEYENDEFNVSSG